MTRAGWGRVTSVVAIYSGKGLAPCPREAAGTLEQGKGAAAKSPSHLLRAGAVEAACPWSWDGSHNQT